MSIIEDLQDMVERTLNNLLGTGEFSMFKIVSTLLNHSVLRLTISLTLSDLSFVVDQLVDLLFSLHYPSQAM